MNQQEAKNQEYKVQKQEVSHGFVLKTYVEIPGHAPEQIDVLKQLQANIAHIEKLQSKMSFMVREIQSLNLKKF